MSWLIVLYGAELSFAHQNQKDFEFEPDCRGVSLGLKKLLALRITQLAVQKFCVAEKALSSSEIADELETPIRLTRDVIFWLTQANVLVTVQGEEEKDHLYQPARDVEDLTIKSVLDLLDQSGSSNIPIAESPALQKLRDSLENFSATLEAQPLNLSMKNLQAPLTKEPIHS